MRLHVMRREAHHSFIPLHQLDEKFKSKRDVRRGGRKVVHRLLHESRASSTTPTTLRLFGHGEGDRMKLARPKCKEDARSTRKQKMDDVGQKRGHVVPTYITLSFVVRAGLRALPSPWEFHAINCYCKILQCRI